uniref:C-type lectin domain-containing protein n=1 Tax=Panagrellus redivivus TaxID=6233 RepID=A0A7E4UX01_PANRE
MLNKQPSPNATKVCCSPFDERVESNGTVFCFARIAIPNNRATIGNYLCRKLHPHANLASFHSAAEVTAVYSLGAVVIGLQYEFDEFSWRGGTPVDFIQWNSYQPSMNTSDAVVESSGNGYFNTITLQGSTSHNALCKMEAEHTECSEFESCILRKTYQDLFCYRLHASHTGHTVQDEVNNNICGKTYPGYDIASIHSKEENDFIVKQAAD